jgi:inner membrane protein
MDSLSQIVLGASVAAVVAPAGQRRRALLIGAALGTLPDLDVLIHFGDPVRDFTMHRGFSHSLFVLPWVGLALWGMWLAVSPLPRSDRWRWLLAFQLALLTHPLLDAMTVYGTQLWWPLQSPPVMIGSIFIIDPLYTVWLLIGVVAAWILRERARAGFWLVMGLLLSTAYLGWTVFAQQHILRAMRIDQAERGVTDARILATPTPLNSIAWRIVVMRGDGDYLEGWYSFAAPARSALMQPHAGNRALIEPLVDDWNVQRLAWFSSGWYGVEQIGEQIVVEDLRMGEEGQYVFRFAVGEQRDGRTVAIAPQALDWPARFNRATLEKVWRRVRTGS